MEVKVNVLNEMKKLRSTTYADRYAWVEEVIQNCQRSKATRVDVTIDYDHVIISDNGVGCTDPQILFDKSSSGWDEETTANESPFGEGFFSTMIVANTITVKSIGFMAIFDVNKMFEENTTDVIEVYDNKKKSGFSLTLTNFTDEYTTWQTESRFKEVAKYIKSPSVYINGEKVKYEGTAPIEDTPFLLKIDNEYFKGWICPQSYRRSYTYSNIVKCFAFDRLVKESYKFAGVRGVLTFKPNSIKLRSPDRKEFIFDDQYDAAVESFRNCIKKMYIRMIREGSDEDLRDYEDKICEYLDLDSYKKHIKFKFLKKPSADISNIGNDNVTVNAETEFDDDYDTAPINDIDSAGITPISDFGTISYALSSTNNINNTSDSDTVIAPKRGRPKIQSAQTGESLDKIPDYAFYVESNSIDAYSEHIELAQMYDIPIIEIRNRLEQSVVENSPSINHIKDMQNMLKISVEYRNMYPMNEQETRATKLLSRVAEAIGANKDLFVIADTTFRKIINVDGKDFTIEELDIFAASSGNQVFINRSHMTAYDDLTDDSPVLTDADIKFLLLNLKLLAQEISHILFHTTDNTIDHEATTNKLMQKIIDLIYSKQRINLCA